MGLGDSTLVIKDMELAQSAASTKEKEQILRSIYDKADKNKSGFLENEEAKIFFGQLYDYLTNKKYIDVGGGIDKKVVVETWMKHYDKNHDGKLEFNEFVKVLDLMWGLKAPTGKGSKEEEKGDKTSPREMEMRKSNKDKGDKTSPKEKEMRKSNKEKGDKTSPREKDLRKSNKEGEKEMRKSNKEKGDKTSPREMEMRKSNKDKGDKTSPREKDLKKSNIDTTESPQKKQEEKETKEEEKSDKGKEKESSESSSVIKTEEDV